MPLPRDVQSFEYVPDPGDELSYGLDCSALLDTGEEIDATSVAITLSAEAVALGVQLLGGELTPAVAAGGKIIIIGLTVDPARRSDPDWQGYGRDVGINAQFSTTGDPPQMYDRDGAINMRNR